MTTVEALIERSGDVHLAEPVSLPSPRRALATILEEATNVGEMAPLSEKSLIEDWNRSEKEASWAHLQFPISGLAG
jgi:hypothetical protein